MADKLEMWDTSGGSGGRGGGGGGGGGSYATMGAIMDSGPPGMGAPDRKTEDKLTKATRDACKITTEVLNGLMTQVEKGLLEFMIAKIGVNI